MKRILILSVVIISFTLKGISQESHNNIEILIKTMHIDSTAKKALRSAIIQQINGKRFTLEDTSAVKAFKSKMEIEEKKIFEKLLNQDIYEILEKNFTGIEIIQLIEFYKTPVGQKTLTFLTEIELKIWKIIIENYNPLITDLVDNLEKNRK